MTTGCPSPEKRPDMASYHPYESPSEFSPHPVVIPELVRWSHHYGNCGLIECEEVSLAEDQWVEGTPCGSISACRIEPSEWLYLQCTNELGVTPHGIYTQSMRENWLY